MFQGVSIQQFNKFFKEEDDCKQYLFDIKWKDGYRCLTIEPKIFGTGDNFATDAKLDINLRLINSEDVNDQGTLITKYAVLKK